MKRATDLVETVGAILNEYIAIHDDVFKFRWRRLLPFGRLLEQIDFHRHVVSLKVLEEELHRVTSASKAIEPTDGPLSSSIANYSTELAHAMRSLRLICAALNAKGARSDSYSRSEYQADLKEYEACVRAYQQTGQQLNRAVRRQT